MSVFTDYGLVSHNEPAGRKPRAELWGTGIQISTYFGSHLDGKFILGWALIDSPYRQAGDLLATFVVGAKF